MKIAVLFICLVSFYGIAGRKIAKFVAETVDHERTDTIEYKKIGTSSYFGLIGQNSIIQCGEVCLNEDSCESYYMEGGACVFGVSGDSHAFEEGEETNPEDGQRIRAKGMFYFSNPRIKHLE